MSSGKILLGVIAGVAAGALLGVLFAPDKGWNTRKRIAKKADEYADGLREKFDEFLDAVTVKMDEAKDEVTDFAEKNLTGTPKSRKEADIANG
jgi:gas vesicle protein